jgi:hypothetical protein
LKKFSSYNKKNELKILVPETEKKYIALSTQKQASFLGVNDGEDESMAVFFRLHVVLLLRSIEHIFPFRVYGKDIF